MKKVITILMVLCVSVALFASVGLTVKAGGTYGFTDMNTASKENDEQFDKSINVKSNGFGFSSGVQYDLSDNLMVYADFTMLFPSDATLKKENGTEKKLSELVKEFEMSYVGKGSYKINYMSISAGAAYKFDLGLPIRLAVGAGVTVNRAHSYIKITEPAYLEEGSIIEYNESLINIGLNALIDAKYMVTDNIGVGLTVMPQLNLYNISKYTMSINGEVQTPETEEANGFKIGFAVPVTVGVSYSF
jgi:opacity protein-like surface antigen